MGGYEGSESLKVPIEESESKRRSERTNKKNRNNSTVYQNDRKSTRDRIRKPDSIFFFSF